MKNKLSTLLFLMLFINIGAKSQDFSLSTTFNVPDLGDNTVPTTVDIDGDGLIDLIIGEDGGKLFHYEQDSLGSETFQLHSNNFNGIDIGSYATPTFVDIDGDGLLDLIIGEQSGNLNHYEQDSPNSLSFSEITSSFNSIDIGNMAVPFFIDIDNNALLDLLVGEYNGKIYHYQQSAINSLIFNLITSEFNGIDVGGRCAPTVCDFNNNGLLDLLAPENNPNVNYYEQITNDSTGFNLITDDFRDLSYSRAKMIFDDINADGIVDFIIGEEDGGSYLYLQEFPVEANFSVSDTVGIIGDTLYFIDLSPGTQTAWEWDFGDGQTSTLQNPTHIYQSDDVFSIQFIIFRGAQSDTLVVENYITIDKPPLTITSTYEDISCPDANDGSIDLTTFDGIIPYTYIWSNGETTEDISNLDYGNYTITVRDNQLQTVIQNFIISEPQVVANVTNLSCFETSDGAINLSPSGGSTPYTYLWENGENTNAVNNLVAGNYKVTVTDDSLCVLDQSISGNPSLPWQYMFTDGNHTILIQNTVNISLNGTTISVGDYIGVFYDSLGTITCGGYKIWTGQNIVVPAIGTEDSIKNGFENNEAFQWKVWRASDGQIFNCTATYDATSFPNTNTYFDNGISSLESLTGTAFGPLLSGINVFQADDSLYINSSSVSNTFCYNANNGTIDISVSGGWGQNTFLWNNSETTEDIIDLFAGEYFVTINDFYGCTTVGNFSIYQPNELLIDNFSLTNILCFDENTGAIDIEIIGGSTPYLFLWSSGETTEDLSNLFAGDYTVTITDIQGCQLTETYTLIQPNAPLNTQIDGNFFVCFGTSDGTATSINSAGGTPPYSYIWSTGETTDAISGLIAGDYYLTITDNHACIDFDNITISEPNSQFSVSLTGTNVDCYSNSTGSVSSTVSGGWQNASYAYQWSNGETSANISNLPAGNYSVTAISTTAATCSATENITISEPNLLLIDNFSLTSILCFDENTGAIDIEIIGGSTPYSYLWSSSETSEDLSNLFAGDYTVTITDNQACQLTETYTLIQPNAPLNTQIDGNFFVCFGTSDGTATSINSAGGTPPYSYIWSTGETTDAISGLIAGDYYLTITDNHACIDFDNITISEPNSQFSVSLTGTNVDCYSNSTGSVSSTVSGGWQNASYAYQWSNGETSANISNLPAGNYSVTAISTTAATCSATENITISEPNLLLIDNFSLTSILCFDENTGAIDIEIIGGSTPYSYLWSSSETSEDLSNLFAGDYTVTITDNQACQLTETYTLIQPNAPLNTQIDGNFFVCFGTNDGTATSINSAGGTPPYSYIWSTGETTDAISGLIVGDYNLTITDNHACMDFDNITIAEPNSQFSVSLTGTNVDCYANSTASVSSAVFGGWQNASYAYQWSNSETSANISNLPAGNYSVTTISTAEATCSATENITISEPNLLIIDNSTISNVLCYGDSTGTIDIEVTGGTAPFSYIWSNGETNDDISNLLVGFYELTFTDANNCQNNFNGTITQPDSVSVSLNYLSQICYGENNGQILANASGGISPYSYLWSSDSTNIYNSINNLWPGIHSVKVTDVNGCSKIETAIIFQAPDSLQVDYANISDVSCFGGNNGLIDITTIGGFGQNSFLWSNGETTEDITGLFMGNYSVTISDVNGCFAEANFFVNQADLLSLYINNTVDVLCFGGSNASIDLEVQGGISPYFYIWSDNSSIQDISNLSAGTYSVTVVDENACIANIDTTISQPDPIILNLNYTENVCYGTFDGEIVANASGGTSPFTYLWSNSETNHTISNLPAGTYTVSISDSNSCTISESASINQANDTLQISILNATNNICNGETNGSIDIIAQGGTMPYTYLWSNAETTANISNLPAGFYSIEITDLNSCIANQSIEITEPAEVSIQANISNLLCFEDNTGAIDITVSGGTPMYSYLWANGQTNEDIQNLDIGIYNITVTDINACTAESSLAITQPDSISLSLDYNQFLCYGMNNGYINPIVSGGTVPYNFVWTNGETNENISNLEAGTYSVTISDINGCSTLASATIEQPLDSFELTNVTITDVTYYGFVDGSIDISLTGGILPYTFNWSNGESAEDLINTGAGIYEITISDNVDCQIIESFEIIQPDVVFPPWPYTQTGTSHEIQIPDTTPITISGLQIEIGDFIGVFYDSLGTYVCAGYQVWVGINTSVIAYGENIGNDGFTIGEQFKWKIWKSTDDIEYYADANYDLTMPDTGYFNANGLSKLTALAGYESQQIALPEGWSIFSTYISPGNPDFNDIFIPILSDIIIAKDNSGQVFWPLYSINSIGDASTGQAYYIKMNLANNLLIGGTALVPENTQISLYENWNMLGYLRNSAASIELLLSPISSSISIVKNDEGNIFWPIYYINMIGDMEPGKGYLINMINPETFYYPPNSSVINKSSIIESNPKYFGKAKNTGLSP